MVTIAIAGNSDVAAYAAIIKKGYEFSISWPGEGREGWYIATKDGNKFIGESPAQTLGLIALFELSGEDWHASEEDVDRFLAMEKEAFSF